MFLPNYRSEAGQSFPVIVLLFIAMLGFVALTIDVGYGLLEKRRLQAAVDLGLLSGARELPDAADAADEARRFVRTNFHNASEESIHITTSTGCLVPGCSAHDKMTLSARTSSPTFFAKLFGIDSWTVAAKGSACGPCDASPATFDVVVVLDRSASMSSSDMHNAKEGIKELFSFFDPSKDRIALAVLESADDSAPYFRPGSPAPPCEGAGKNYPDLPLARNDAYGDYRQYAGSNGSFMDGTAGNHDSWLIVGLHEGTDFKREDGTINSDSHLVRTLECIRTKASTPIGPAIEAAHDELMDNVDPVTRADSLKVIVYFGDGGASSMPLKRECRTRERSRSSRPWSSWSSWGACTTESANGDTDKFETEWAIRNEKSWYDWSGSGYTGNRDRPCADAVAKSQEATDDEIMVYTIGYGVSTDYCAIGAGSSYRESPNIRQRDTIIAMASEPEKAFVQTSRGDVSAIFREVGRDITAGGTRLVS